MRDVGEDATSEVSKVKPVGSNNNISDQCDAKGTSKLSDLLVRSRRRVTGKSAI